MDADSAVERQELLSLLRISEQINAGFTFEQIMETVYEAFRGIIPYDRIGLAMFADSGRKLRACWHKADYPTHSFHHGYTVDYNSASLARVLASNEPRIINNLHDYHLHHPESSATRHALQDGILSSLTCPLWAPNGALGFLFFSSRSPSTYAAAHVETFRRIAAGVAIAIEKGRLVSELVEQKKTVSAQNEELQRLNELKNSLLGMAAHDLRGPASNIKAVAEMLADAEIELSAEDENTLLDTALRQSVHMLSLIDGLLDVNKIENGKLVLKPLPVNVPFFLEEIIRDQNRFAARKGVRVIADRIAPGTVCADPVRLRQILDNLISNGVKFTPRQTKVLVHAARENGCWRFSVRDQGPGLTEQDLACLFAEFQPLSAQPTAGEKSHGLGLAITSRLVRAHGGEIGVESNPGAGATFWFTLPAQG